MIAEPTNFKVGTFQETANILDSTHRYRRGGGERPDRRQPQLPPGVTADHVGGNSNWYAFCTVINAGAEVTCPLQELTPSSSALVVPVDVDNTAPALISSEFEISGGGAPTVKRTLTNPVSDAKPPFSYLSFSAFPTDPAGDADTIAADHPRFQHTALVTPVSKTFDIGAGPGLRAPTRPTASNRRRTS